MGSNGPPPNRKPHCVASPPPPPPVYEVPENDKSEDRDEGGDGEFISGLIVGSLL